MSDIRSPKKSTRRKALQNLASGAVVSASAGFYSTLLASTKALASADVSEEDLILKKLTEGLQEKLAPIEKKSLWAGLKFGDGDKYGGPMEEYYAKKK